MTTESFNIGDKQRFDARFTDDQGVAKDPTDVVATLREPDGVVTNLTAVNDAVGLFHVDLTFAKEGRHFLEIAGTGVVVSAEETEFYVKVRNAS